MVGFNWQIFQSSNYSKYTCKVPYKTIYWRGINISDWRFFRRFANIKIANNYMDTPTKPLQKLEKKDMVAQIANIKSANCFLQTNSPNITLANKYSCTVFLFTFIINYYYYYYYYYYHYYFLPGRMLVGIVTCCIQHKISRHGVQL